MKCEQKAFLHHVVIEALQLVFLLGQRQVQVQVVSIRRQLQGAVLQLRDRQRQLNTVQHDIKFHSPVSNIAVKIWALFSNVV